MKIAVISGTSSGIGKTIAEQLLKENWKVYGLSRSKPVMDNDNFVWLKCDLQKPDEITMSLQGVSEPNIDALISNAGVAFGEMASEVTQESYEKIFSVNVLAPMLIVNALKDKLFKSTIISISSVSDRIPEKDFALYCSSKAANTIYFNSLANELKEAKVYTLLPDYVDTPMLRRLQENNDFDWSATIKAGDLAKLIGDLIFGEQNLESGSNIIIVTTALKDDLKRTEKLYGFNIDTNELTKL